MRYYKIEIATIVHDVTVHPDGLAPPGPVAGAVHLFVPGISADDVLEATTIALSQLVVERREKR